jgi:hypothetical protein
LFDSLGIEGADPFCDVFQAQGRAIQKNAYLKRQH